MVAFAPSAFRSEARTFCATRAFSVAACWELGARVTTPRSSSTRSGRDVTDASPVTRIVEAGGSAVWALACPAPSPSAIASDAQNRTGDKMNLCMNVHECIAGAFGAHRQIRSDAHFTQRTKLLLRQHS